MNKADKNDVIDRAFVLNEQDFRRLNDTARDQLTKKGNEDEIVSSFTIKFKNGTIYETTSIDEVLSLENGGSGAIKQIEAVSQLTNESYRIRFKYSDPDYTDKDVKPIAYSVYGEDRDWVFVSNSQIEERLNTTTRTKAASPKMEVNGFMALFMIGILVSFFFIVDMQKERVSFWDYDKEWEAYIEEDIDAIEDLKKFAKDNPDAKPVEVFIKYKEITELEREVRNKAIDKQRKDAQAWALKENGENMSSNILMLMMFASGLVLPLLYLLYSSIAKYVYPLYVFSWGDEKASFEKRDSARKYVLGTLVAGIIVSFVAGVLANMI